MSGVAAAPALSCTDSKGNTYNVDVLATDGEAVTSVIFSAHNVIALNADDLITVTNPLTLREAVSANEFSGLAPTGTLDQIAGSAGLSTSPSSGDTPGVTAQPDELLIGGIGALEDEINPRPARPNQAAFVPGPDYIAMNGAITPEDPDITDSF